MNVRRSAAVLAATVVIGAATPAVAATPSPSPSVAIPDGLYGSTDPTYDGVWRQSLALLAQHTVDVKPAAKAVGWLAGQQCANGAFAAFRADTAKACDAKLVIDTNSTAAAAQTLAALGGHATAVDKAVTWLKSVQNKDGGWGYTPGGPSDTNSTSVVVGALVAAGEKPAEVAGDGEDGKGGKSPYDLLAKWSLTCGADDGGALAYQPDKKGKLAANADATAAGVLGSLGKGFVATAGQAPKGVQACADSDKPLAPQQVAANGAAYLAEATQGGFLKSALPGAKDQPDYGNTADAVVALAAQGSTSAARKPYAWLEKNATAWARQSGPAAYAQLILAAHTMGTDPHDFGGTDLVKQLNATGPAPQAAEKTTKAADKKDSDDGFGVWWTVGVFLVAGIGIGFLLSGRNRKQQP
ncbi:prenyltransferase/squalene oxidase repeat-containing protein [Streptomyces sp. NPDC002888]|uniref:prenyltransferase/squalene oxidase repeat-containing protein n=1 Tax=Streptomyces sp. NPDC002888 TaxID=3364668 RepID=UPI0036A0B422